MKVNEIFDILNGFAPVSLACDWDNCGILAGDGEAEVTGVYVTLDADLYALEKAVENGCNLVVSHHPIIFDRLSAVTGGQTVYHYVTNSVSVISMHTCLDAADGGVNDVFAKLLELQNTEKVIIEGTALARMGDVDCKDADEYIDKIKAALSSERVDYTLCSPIFRVMSVSGSGGSALDIAKALGADTLITGEAKHEHFVHAKELGINLITLGHFETENIIIAPLCKLISKYVKAVCDDRKQIVNRR